MQNGPVSVFFKSDGYTRVPDGFCKTVGVGNFAHAGITVTAGVSIEQDQAVAAVEHQVSGDDVVIKPVAMGEGNPVTILLVAVQL